MQVCEREKNEDCSGRTTCIISLRSLFRLRLTHTMMIVCAHARAIGAVSGDASLRRTRSAPVSVASDAKVSKLSG
jgi:hypothetical protein